MLEGLFAIANYPDGVEILGVGMGGILPEPKKCPVVVQNVKENVRPADGVENGKFASPAA